MERQEFLNLLEQNQININLVSFEPNLKDDSFCIRKNHFRWEVFYLERGGEYETMGFPSESNALEYLYEKLLKTTKRQGTVP